MILRAGGDGLSDIAGGSNNVILRGQDRPSDTCEVGWTK